MRFIKNYHFAAGAVAFLCAVFLFAGTPSAMAASFTPAQVSAITSLLQSFGVDAGTVLTVQNILENQATTSSSGQPPADQNTAAENSQGASGTCQTLSNGLHLGSTDSKTGGEVSRLQSFLGRNRSVYPEDLVTGYFGSSTEAAVQRWQMAHGIVSSGSEDSTGFGYVGPRTRGEMDKEMEMECEQGDQQTSLGHTASSTQENSSDSHASENESNTSNASSTQGNGSESGN